MKREKQVGMNREDAYYEPEDYSDGEKIQELIDHKLKNENYPYSADNILEALHNDALVPHLDTIATFLSNDDTANAGLILSSAIYTWWEKMSEREVIGDL